MPESVTLKPLTGAVNNCTWEITASVENQSGAAQEVRLAQNPVGNLVASFGVIPNGTTKSALVTNYVFGPGGVPLLDFRLEFKTSSSTRPWAAGNGQARLIPPTPPSTSTATFTNFTLAKKPNGKDPNPFLVANVDVGIVGKVRMAGAYVTWCAAIKPISDPSLPGEWLDCKSDLLSEMVPEACGAKTAHSEYVYRPGALYLKATVTTALSGSGLAPLGTMTKALQFVAPRPPLLPPRPLPR